MHTPHVMSGGRYPVLRSLAIIYVIGGALAAVSTILTAGYVLISRFAWTDKLIMFVGALTAGFFLVLTMLAIAEVLKLFIDVEHNTRMAANAGRMATPASTTIVATAPETPAMAAADGNGAVVVTTSPPATNAHINRLDQLDEETAEAALLRGH